MTNYGLEFMLRFGHIRIFTGRQPESADMAETGNLIGIVSTDGIVPTQSNTSGGLTMTTAESFGMLIPNGNWVLKGVAEGIAGWWRFVGHAYDDGGDSVNRPRIDGKVGESLILPDDHISVNTNEEIDSFSIYFPHE